ncbi:MADS-box transcription factor 29-like [Hordeum vulgare subsp. vulgare]|uniref:MADS-box transcription factor 29-like n=1 Tax=Hordeum vulgare subsp. vulgare TaxID=112509 RepID=UPI001D1A58CE|nr:MADS-box transcription factor 29-like [Hordeum vulgare subsp. vulgare]
MVDDDGGVSRRATFGELLTEAQELDALCEADVGVLVFDSAGRQIDYCSPRTSWSELTQRYKSISNNKFQGINRDDDHQVNEQTVTRSPVLATEYKYIFSLFFVT